jgi:hypothetical protein
MQRTGAAATCGSAVATAPSLLAGVPLLCPLPHPPLGVITTSTPCPACAFRLPACTRVRTVCVSLESATAQLAGGRGGSPLHPQLVCALNVFLMSLLWEWLEPTRGLAHAPPTAPALPRPRASGWGRAAVALWAGAAGVGPRCRIPVEFLSGHLTASPVGLACIIFCPMAQGPAGPPPMHPPHASMQTCMAAALSRPAPPSPARLQGFSCLHRASPEHSHVLRTCPPTPPKHTYHARSLCRPRAALTPSHALVGTPSALCGLVASCLPVSWFTCGWPPNPAPVCCRGGAACTAVVLCCESDLQPTQHSPCRG